jgi:hypothetical protein
MPVVPPNKFARTSAQGWSRKRSASPAGASKASSSSTKKTTSDDEFVPRRSDDGLYYEEEYREEHLEYLLEMEVSSACAHPRHTTPFWYRV